MTTTGHLNILGTRGIPAAHGGFETFAERLSLYLVSRGFSVTVYCQSSQGEDLRMRQDSWHGVSRVFIGTRREGALGTMEFDLACVRDVLKRPGSDLVLGYNTAIFNLLQRLKGRQVFMNMDGIEWKREKWSLPARAWLWGNEFIGARLASAPVADHPDIAEHIHRRTGRKPVVIPYGADVVGAAGDGPLRALGVQPREYFISVARVVPENSILEIVRAHERANTGLTLLLLGTMDPDNAYHKAVRQAAGKRVIFPGAIYKDTWVKSLRFHARAYLHGHQVGGTNPSLVEALGAGNPVIAHDNRFNRWTAGARQHFFTGVADCADHMSRLARNDLAAYAARMAARERHAEAFRWQMVLGEYERLMLGSVGLRDQIAAE